MSLAHSGLFAERSNRTKVEFHDQNELYVRKNNIRYTIIEVELSNQIQFLSQNAITSIPSIFSSNQSSGVGILSPVIVSHLKKR